MFLKEVVLWDESEESTLYKDSLCISEMFRWELKKKIKTEDTEALFIHCGKYEKVAFIREEQEAYSVLVPKKSVDVMMPFDQERYTQLNKQEKKKMLADVLIKGVLFVADKKNLNQAFIKDAYRKMVKKEFNHYVKPWKKQLSPNKRFKAYPMVRLDLDFFELEVVIEREKKVIVKKSILTCEPDFHTLWYAMRELKWLSNHEVALYTRAHKETYTGIKIPSLEENGE